MKSSKLFSPNITAHGLDHRCLAVVATIFGYCYVLRLALVYASPDLVDWTMPVSAHSLIRDDSVFWNTAGLISVFIFGFLWATGTLLLLLSTHQNNWRDKLKSQSISFNLKALLTLAASTAGIWLALLLFAFGIGVQGQAPATALPFKLAGILVYLKNSVIPVMLLACVLLFERDGHTIYSRLAALSLVTLGFLDMAMFDTRGAALKSLIYLALLWWISKFKLQRADKMLIVFIALTLPIMIAAVTEVRLYGTSLDSSTIERLLGGINFLLFRVTGAEHLMAVVGFHVPLGLQGLGDVLSSPRGIPGYYTTELLGVDPNLPQTFAPSGLGWLYIFGGPLMVGFGGVILGLLSVGVYNWLPKNLPVLGSAAKSLYIFTLAMVLSEGTFEAPLISFILGYATLWLLEISLKSVSVQYHLNHGALS